MIISKLLLGRHFTTCFVHYHRITKYPYYHTYLIVYSTFQRFYSKSFNSWVTILCVLLSCSFHSPNIGTLGDRLFSVCTSTFKVTCNLPKKWLELNGLLVGEVSYKLFLLHKQFIYVIMYCHLQSIMLASRHLPSFILLRGTCMCAYFAVSVSSTGNQDDHTESVLTWNDLSIIFDSEGRAKHY